MRTARNTAKACEPAERRLQGFPLGASENLDKSTAAGPLTTTAGEAAA
jgi:hypothetical protein